MAMDGEKTRAVNAEVGQSYDAIPYEPLANDNLDVANIVGLAALYGCAGEFSDKLDILDLGCGRGLQLERLASQIGGSLTGIDISEKATARARERCPPDRTRIVCSDFLDLDAETLGKFDVIYHIGVIFLMPRAVQERIFELIARCLKPGGVAVMSYYAGSVPLMRGGLYRVLRTGLDPALTPEERVGEARKRLQEIMASPQRDELKSLLKIVDAQQDIMLFHEALNPAWEVMDTPRIEEAVSAHSAQFLNYLFASPFGAVPSSRERALAADIFDFASGGSYRYAVFGKPAAQDFNLQTSSIRWRSRLARTEKSASYAAPATYASPGFPVRIARGDTQAALDELASGPRTWTEMVSGAEKRLGGAVEAGAFEKDMIGLWNVRLITPVWEPALASPR